jgi:hypothetical protein
MSDTEPTDADEPNPPAASPPPMPPPIPPPMPPPMPMPVAPTQGWGPPGKIRKWGMVALLTIVTCGIYGIFWQYAVFKENQEHSHEGVGGVVGVLLAIFVGIVNIFLIPAEVGKIYDKAGQAKPVKGTTGFWALIPIAGWFIWLYKVQNAINQRWEQMGVVPA